MEEPQSGAQETQYRRCPVLFSRKRRGRSRLVVVLEKPRRPHLEFHVGTEMIAHRAGMSVPQPIIETFIVGVIESLLL